MSENNLLNGPRLPLAKFNKLVNLTLKRLFAAEAVDTTREQEVILRELCQTDGVNQAQLALRVGQDRNNLSRTLRLLEERGLIRREVLGTDKRHSRVEITPEGRKLHAKALAAIEKYRTILFDGLSPQEIAALTDSIEQLTENLTKFVDVGSNSNKNK